MSSGFRSAMLVVGMHRSGTSLAANVLALLGADLPSRMMQAADSNPQGHFEPEAIVALHDRVLAGAGSSWSDWRAIPDGWLQSAEVQEIAAEISSAIHVDYGDSKLFVIKDPRLCRLVPLWRSVVERVPCRPFYILPYRNPIEVAQSLKWRNGLDTFQSHMLWLRHVLEAEYATRGGQRVLIRYDDLLTDPASALQRMISTLPVPWPRSPRSVEAELRAAARPQLRHHRAPDGALASDTSIPAWLSQTYDCMELLHRDPTDQTAWETLDGIRASFNAVTRAFSSAVEKGDEHLAGPQPGETERTRRKELERLRRQLAMHLSELATAQDEIANLNNLLDVNRKELAARARRLTDYETRLEASAARIARLFAELEASTARAANLTAEVETNSAKTTLLTAGLEASAARTAQLSAELKATSAAAADLRLALDRAQAQTREQHEAFVNSRSWKATAPLRRIGRRFVRRETGRD